MKCNSLLYFMCMFFMYVSIEALLKMCSVGEARIEKGGGDHLAQRYIAGTKGNDLILIKTQTWQDFDAIIVKLRAATNRHDSIAVRDADARPRE